MKKYNEEKILYFADRPTGFNVDINEPADTDITRIVGGCILAGYLYIADQDDSDVYYRTTLLGQKRLAKYKADYQLNKMSRG